CFDGLATVCDVLVDGEPVLESRSMFLRHEVPFRGGSELAIQCRPLEPPGKTRARWRSPIADNKLRWFRTTLVGRTSFAPGLPPVGPWRPVRIERRRAFAIDELRLRPRQDFIFANFDYPGGDPEFRGLVEAEARQELSHIAGRPSLAMLCGNSEVEQQVAMLGLEPDLARSDLFDELLPSLAREAGADVPY